MYIRNNSLYLYYYLFVSFIIYLLYPLLFIFLNNLFKREIHLINNNFDNFNLIKPVHKKIYLISNLIKSIFLGIYTPYAISIIYLYFVYNIWNINLIKHLGGLYASLDLISIFYVKKMQINTIIHHILVQILYLYSLLCLNFSENTLANAIVIYACFSTLAFLVNFYLATRLLIKNKYRLTIIKKTSNIIYKTTCFFNWTYQLYYIIFSFHINIFIRIIYFLLLSGIIYDDLILIQFLNK